MGFQWAMSTKDLVPGFWEYHITIPKAMDAIQENGVPGFLKSLDQERKYLSY